jgi:hypothetical protein
MLIEVPFLSKEDQLIKLSDAKDAYRVNKQRTLDDRKVIVKQLI